MDWASDGGNPHFFVEVVCCKDCKYWDRDWLCSQEDSHYCPKLEKAVESTFYCKYGERR